MIISFSMDINNRTQRAYKMGKRKTAIRPRISNEKEVTKFTK